MQNIDITFLEKYIEKKFLVLYRFYGIIIIIFHGK